MAKFKWQKREQKIQKYSKPKLGSLDGKESGKSDIQFTETEKYGSQDQINENDNITEIHKQTLCQNYIGSMEMKVERAR